MLFFAFNANSVDSDETSFLCVWSATTLFALSLLINARHKWVKELEPFSRKRHKHVQHTVSLKWLENSLGPWKLIRDKGSSSYWGLIMMSGQEANNDIVEVFLIFYTIMACCVYSLESPHRGDYKSTLNKQFHNEIRKFLKYLLSWATGRIS